MALKAIFYLSDSWCESNFVWDNTLMLVYFIAEYCPQPRILQISYHSHTLDHHPRYCHRQTWGFHNWIRLVGDPVTNVVRKCSPRLFCFVTFVRTKHKNTNISGKIIDRWYHCWSYFLMESLPHAWFCFVSICLIISLWSFEGDIAIPSGNLQYIPKASVLLCVVLLV